MDSQTANLIAAGEVVERPAGVVKELVENAIDAGSTRIAIVLEEGGLKKITVTDNGSGMDAADAQACFGRHATSKIHAAKDLWSIHTLGFRGEALPSIASVSKVTLLTSDGRDATKVVIAYGKPVSVSSYPCSQGTEISVEGLFYETPARLKHMRSSGYEGSLVQDIVYKFALSHPEIAFHLMNDGRDSFRTSGQGDLLEVIFNIYGQGAASAAIPVHFEDYDYIVDGYLIGPSITRASRNAMQIDLNGRMVRTYKLYKAVQEGYAEFIPNGRYPLCILSVQMDPHLMDVNVHPSKWEVRLSKENQLEVLLRENVHAALANGGALKHINETKASVQYYQPLSFDTDDLMPPREEPEKAQPLKEETPFVMDEKMRQSIQKEMNEENARLHEQEAQEKEEVYEAPSFPELRVIGQYRESYIVAESAQGLVLIDQHAASERIAFEKIRAELEDTATYIPLLLPITIKAGTDVVGRLEELNETCKQVHIHFESFGPDTLAVREVPAWMRDIEKETFLQDLIDSFKNENDKKKVVLDSGHISTLAASMAVKKARHFSVDEMKQLVNNLSRCMNPYQDAHGHNTMIIFDDKNIKKEFA